MKILSKLKLHKFKILAVVLGVFVSASVLFAAYKLGQKQVAFEPVERPISTPETVSTSTPIPTANWRTYTNAEYGYSIRYPNGWQETVYNFTLTLEAPETFYPEGTGVIKGFSITISKIAEKARDYNELFEVSKREIPDIQESGEVKSREKLLVAGNEAVLVEHSMMAANLLTSIFLRNPNSNEVIRISATYNEDGLNKHFQTFNLILSTFKFLPSAGLSQGEKKECVKTETGEEMTLSEAKEIALKSECFEEGNLKEKHFCNQDTGTWWIDLDIEKEGCAPACVINISSKKAEINWRCTGLINP